MFFNSYPQKYCSAAEVVSFCLKTCVPSKLPQDTGLQSTFANLHPKSAVLYHKAVYKTWCCSNHLSQRNHKYKWPVNQLVRWGFIVFVFFNRFVGHNSCSQAAILSLPACSRCPLVTKSVSLEPHIYSLAAMITIFTFSTVYSVYRTSAGALKISENKYSDCSTCMYNLLFLCLKIAGWLNYLKLSVELHGSLGGDRSHHVLYAAMSAGLLVYL